MLVDVTTHSNLRQMIIGAWPHRPHNRSGTAIDLEVACPACAPTVTLNSKTSVQIVLLISLIFT